MEARSQALFLPKLVGQAIAEAPLCGKKKPNSALPNSYQCHGYRRALLDLELRNQRVHGGFRHCRVDLCGGRLHPQGTRVGPIKDWEGLSRRCLTFINILLKPSS